MFAAEVVMKDIKRILALVFFAIGCILLGAIINKAFNDSATLDNKFTATIRVTDRFGNPANVLPKSVVCLAERAGETLICRVESIK